jgi:dTDP-glucose pyrophosphorylase
MRQNNIQEYFVYVDYIIRRVIEIIDKTKDGIALVVDKKQCLIGTITDGDIRRFLLVGGSFDEPCSKVMWEKPVTAPLETPKKELQFLMDKHRLRCIPLVDEKGRPSRIVGLQELISEENPHQTAIIMAGGEGKRLRPLTENIPKPMVNIGDRPLLESIILDLKKAGINKVYISINYKADIIKDYFKCGEDFGIEIIYLHEQKKLGTAGALSLLPEKLPGPAIIINGDVVTNISFERLLEFHRQRRCLMSVAAIEYHIEVPYGVLDLANHFVLGIEEKPSQRFLCNAGIYVIDPELLRFVPSESFYNMTDLLQDVVREGLPVAAFPIHEYWVDIGQKKDLDRAVEDLKSDCERFNKLEKES